jgi:hypothetical protein
MRAETQRREISGKIFDEGAIIPPLCRFLALLL